VKHTFLQLLPWDWIEGPNPYFWSKFIRAASVGSFRVTDDIRVLLGEEGHSGSHFFLIFSDYRSQE